MKTPAGKPTSCIMAASSRQVRLHTSEGFRMQQLPAARAGATFHCMQQAGDQAHVGIKDSLSVSTTPRICCAVAIHALGSLRPVTVYL